MQVRYDRFLHVAVAVILMTSCAEGEFSGAANQGKKPEPPAPVPSQQVDTTTTSDSKPEVDPDIIIPNDCGDGGALQAKILTPEVQNGAAEMVMEFEVFLVSCTKEKIFLSNEPFRHAVESTSNGVENNLPRFQFFDLNGKLLSEGGFETVWGKDFEDPSKSGSFGSFYIQTKPLNLTAETERVKLRIIYRNQKLTPPPGQSSPTQDYYDLNTFLAFGKAAIAKRTIRFKNK